MPRDYTFAGQRLQVFFSGVGRAKAQFGCDLGAGGRSARAGDGTLNQVQNLLLAGSKLHLELRRIHRGHSCWVWWSDTVLIHSNCIFDQFFGICKP